MRYYHYISKQKVEMLLPQLQRSQPSFKVSPKMEVPGFSVGVDIESQSQVNLVKSLTDLLVGMRKQDRIKICIGVGVCSKASS